MTPPPSPVSLWVCEQVVIDRRTNNPSLIGSFTGLRCLQFPSDRTPLSAYVSMTGAVGRGRIELQVIHLESMQSVFRQRGAIEFPDRITILNIDFRIRTLSFPEAGTYSFAVLVDGDLIAERKLRVSKG